MSQGSNVVRDTYQFCECVLIVLKNNKNSRYAKTQKSLWLDKVAKI